MVQGGMSCVKYLMFVFNFIFVVCGIALIAVGAIVMRKDLTSFLDSKYVTAPTIIIVVGVIIFVLAFLGCCGAIKENYCMVTMFGILLFIIFIVEIAGGIAAYVYKDQFEDVLKKSMNDSLVQNKTDFTSIWNEIQHNLQCCGVNGAEDYVDLKRPIPETCCKDERADTCTQVEAYKRGCFNELLAQLKHYITMVGGAAIGIAVIELLGCMFAWCLAAAIKKEYEGV